MMAQETGRDGLEDAVGTALDDTQVHGHPSLLKGRVIMQVIPSLVTGGAERGCVDVAAGIVEAGGMALVVSEGGPMTREFDRIGARHIPLPVASKNPFVIWRNAGRLASEIASFGVDIIHARSRAPAWSSYWAASRCDVPFMTTFHAPYNFDNALKKRYNSVMTMGDRVIAISDFIARHVVTQYNADPARIRTVHRGIDIDVFAPDRVSPERLIQLAERWRLPDDLPVILLPGRLTRWKGQTVLIEALAKLGRRDVRCLLVGDDQGRDGYRRELEALIKDKGLDGVVDIVGHCNDMAAAYMLSDVVVSASTDPEAFGRVIVEAQAMGRPVVVSDHGAVAETMVEGKTGWVVPVGDADALAGALDTILALSKDDREALYHRAIAHARSRFTRTAMVAKTVEIYAELLAERDGQS